MSKKISILGSTGSIGTQTLAIVDDNKELVVKAIAANSNIQLLEKQARKYKVSLVAVYDEKQANILKDNLKDTNIHVVSGMDGLIKAATYNDVDIVVTAVVGMIGILPTIEAIKSKKDIALANKETLVTAGHIIIPLAKKNDVKIYPVDSEHSAIFQCLNGENNKKIKNILLTASGGPFRGKTLEELKNVTVKEALAHPNWSMGKKITIDSATMVNKGLEVIEAKWLFNVPVENVIVVVQPQSIIHSMVEFIDNSIIAQLGTPDMMLPIQYALFYPERRYINTKPLDLFAISNIIIEKPDLKTFKGLSLAYKAGNIGGSMPTVLNAANEFLVKKFLEGSISFLEISNIIEECMNNHKTLDNPSIEDILKVEKTTYEYIEQNFSFRNAR